MQDETRKSGRGRIAANHAARPASRGQIEEHRLQRRAVRADAGAQLIERALGDHPAVRDDADSVREPLRDLENMRGHDDRRARPHALGQNVLHLPGGGGVEAGQRLVEHQEPRLMDERAGERQLLPHAARKSLAAIAPMRP